MDEFTPKTVRDKILFTLAMEDDFSMSDLCDLCDAKDATVRRVLAELLSEKLVTVTRNGDKASSWPYRLNRLVTPPSELT